MKPATDVPASQTLAVLLQHPAVGSDQQIICKLLQVCKAWRTAVQQSAGGLTAVSAKRRDSNQNDTEQLSALAGLGAWLSSYPSLVRSVSIRNVLPSWNEELILAARRILEVGLQLAAVGGGTRALAQAAACSAPTVAAHNAWRLESYDSDLIVTPAMLAAFGSATLTRLDLDGARTADTTGVLAHLKRLHNLKHLAITPYDHYASVDESASILAAIATLRQLTSLTLNNAVHPAPLQQLPVQLQQLTVQVQRGSMVVGHLTSLRELELYMDDPIEPNCVLPAQLKRLTLCSGDRGPLDALGITKLQQLQYLAVTSPLTDRLQLMSLTSMSVLEELHLENQDGARFAAHVYPNLTMLHSLDVLTRNSSGERLIEACKAAALASSITRLHLNLEHCPMPVLDSDTDTDEEADELHVCGRFRSLVHLRELSLKLVASNPMASPFGRGYLAKLNAVHLTALSGLTCLSIQAAGGVDDTVACALATALKQLQHLTLAAGKLTTAPLPALGCLSELRHLDLPAYTSEAADAGLEFLSRLSRLTYLGGFEASDQEMLDAIWACIHGQYQ